jgi:hypothetical protein
MRPGIFSAGRSALAVAGDGALLVRATRAGLGWLVRVVVFAVIVLGLYGVLRLKRAELVDFVVPRAAAERFMAIEPLYRPEDGHYQYKYLPAFALAMVPFTGMPKEVAQFTWFALMVAMAWALLRLTLAALPNRRMAANRLIWLTLLLNGKFLVKELAYGQFNLPLALSLMLALIAAQNGRAMTAGAMVAAGVFVKPYALVLTPWLAWRLGWRSLVPFAAVLVAGLMLPAAWYGWDGNVMLLREWYRTVTETTGPNLMGADNMSFGSLWAKWIGPGRAAAWLALASAIAAAAAGIVVMSKGRRVAEPHYLEVAYFLVLVPLLSPQGWDYVLIIALPAYMCLVDRWSEMPVSRRAMALTGFCLTSFTIFDLLRRPLYTYVMEIGVVSVGAVLIAICLIDLRSRATA